MANQVEIRSERLREISTRLLALGAEKRQSFLGFLEQQGIVALQLPIVAAPQREALPLSYAQQRLWLLEQLHPDTGLYNIHSALRLVGELDVRALRLAIGALIERHEVLRTTFCEQGGTPVQSVAPAQPFDLVELDLSGLDAARREQRAGELSRAQAARPFDLSSAPLVRASLLRWAEREHRLLITIHHIAFDEWSDKVLTEEFVRLYTAFAAGAANPLPKPPLQYADYALWQRCLLTGPLLERQLDYWRRALGSDEYSLALPTDFVRPALPSHAGASVHFELPAELFARLDARARERGVTSFMLVLAAFHVLLAGYSGQRDVRTGVPVSGRSRSELEGLIGFFSNTQVLRTDVNGALGFDQYLASVQRVVADAQSHQDLPFEQLVDALAPERRLNHSPLFEVMLSWHRAGEGSGGAIAGLEVHSERTEQQIAKFDLSLHVTELPRGLRAELNYRTDLFRRATIERMSRHLVRLIGAALADGRRPLAELAWLDLGEREQALAGWNRAEVGHERLNVHARIQRAGARCPEREAVRGEQGTLTHAELEALSNRAARWLTARGVGPEQRVGLCLARGVELVVWLYAVLKSGAAYVPLDPKLPSERLRDTVRDAGLRLVLSREALADALAGTGAELVSPGVADTLALAGPALSVSVHPDSAVYVIYTSGSTGKPKGVVVTHRGLDNYVEGLLGRLALPEGASLAMVSTVAADLGNTVLFGALCSGRTLHLLSEELVFDAERLGDYFERHGVGALKIVPSHLAGLMQGSQPARVLPRHTLVLGGERSSWELIERVREHGACRIFNHYGPTETTVGVLSGELRPGWRGQSASLPLGTPLDNSRVYVLSPELQPLPGGVPGEVYIGGQGVARGYLNRPELTAERFVPDPFAADGSRLYRTGDRARHLPDGALEFLGRIDEQVKIRGYRVELGEIRAELLALAGVAGAEVVVRQGLAGQNRLVAYLIADGTPDEAALAAALARRLPDYMLPADYVWLASFPLTPNGKLDRRALPEPGPGARQARVAPRTPAEQKLAEIWCEVLGLQAVGVEDNFFTVGGDSLLAFQVIALAKRAGFDVVPHAVFEHQTIAALAGALAAPAAGAADDAVPESAAGERIRPQPRAERSPLSFAQERLWFLWRLEPRSSAYNVPRAVRLRGVLDRAALERTFAALVARHEVLRTRFAEEDGRAYQIVLEPWLPRIADLDLSALPEPERLASARLRAEQAAREPFDLVQGPLLRLELLRLAGNDHVLLLGTHHIISDGWSTSILVDEFVELYEALRAGREPQLPELPIQYRDYAVWQRGWLESAALERQLDYWRGQLGNEHPVLELPSDRPRPAVSSQRGDTYRFEIDPELLAGLQAFARARQVTLFMVLLAGFQALLQRYTGQAEIRVGVPSANRGRPEVERLIGVFINTQVIQARPSAAQSFASFVDQVRQASLAAQAHQELPFERLVDALNPERSLAHNPLYQVLFNHQRREYAALQRLTQLELEEFSFGSDSTQLDLSLETFEEPGQLLAAFTYATDLFERETIEQLASHFVRLLRGAVACPEAALSALPLLSEAERQRVLVEWNASEREFPGERSLVELIEEQVERTPGGLAARFGEERVTYAELDERANRLAHCLVARGVGPDVLVGVSVERSLELLVSVLGVLKAGGAYVPLDPSYPRERLQVMLEDARPRVLLTQGSLLEQVPEGGWSVFCVDGEVEELGRAPAERVEVRRHPEQLAYCIYTSGSTGKPKGVGVQHRALVNFLNSMRRAPGLGATDRVLALTSLSFDIAGLELYLPLLSGASVSLVSREAAGDPEALLAQIEEEEISVVQATPATWRMVTDAARPGALSGVRALCGGEALPAELAERLLEQSRELWNVYGPTETTVWSALYRLDAEHREPLLGGPIDNTQLYVLDEALSPVPVGASGELYIGGAGLARGYLHRPELTAERFVPSPFGAAGERLYRTGDVARQRRDGALQYLGRADQQVKIRGHRIELGEIEARLLSHEAVRAAVVVVREDASGDKRLVAYAVVARPAEQRDAIIEDLRRHLGVQLAEYMLPQHYVLLAELPLTPNGKVNRKALPAPDASEAQGRYVAPRGELEERVGEIWSEVLGVERVSRHDDFFRLGGHSLLAARVVTRLAQQTGREVALRVLFEASELWRFAERVSRAPWAARGGVPPLVPVGRGSALPLSYAQQRLWFLWKLEPESGAYNIPYAVRLSGELEKSALRQAFVELVRRHEALRTRFAEADGQTAQLVDEPYEPAVVEVELGGLPESEREERARELAESEAGAGFDLERGPLVRLKLLALAEREHVLLITMHHIISDAQSMAVLVEEFGELYTAQVQGRGAQLPAVAVQYADYAVWQRRWLEGGELERQLGYWKGVLGEEHPVLELGSDRARPAVSSHAGASVALELPEELAAGLRRFARGRGLTPFMVLLAGFEALLYRYSGQKQLRVGIPNANRSRVETERCIGFFVNTLVSSVELDGGVTFEALLERVREGALGAQAHQDLPFEQLVEALNPERSLSHSPLFQVMYNHQADGREAGIALPRLQLSAFARKTHSSQLDLTLDTSESLDGRIFCSFTYATDLFDPQRIAQLARDYERLLWQAIQRAHLAIGALPLLTAEEALAACAPPPLAGAFTPVTEQIAAHARRRPTARALSAGGDVISYAELEQRSAALAAALRAALGMTGGEPQLHGPGGEPIVGLCVERGLDMVVAALAILRAGAAYLPIDPEAPPARVAGTLQDAGARAVLGHTRLLERLELPAGTLALGLESLRPRAASAAKPLPGLAPGRVAYVIYTSGSSGKPKGVAVEHGALARHAAAMLQRLELGERDRSLHFAAFSFDAAVEQWLLPLCSGGELVIMGSELWSPERLLSEIERQGLTRLDLPPLYLVELARQASERGQTLGVRSVTVGGEALPGDRLALITGALAGAPLFNAYGPTEAVVTPLVWRAESSCEGRFAPIGTPLGERAAYVLDERLAPVPAGVVGELYLAGLLARGYHRRPELTAASFLPNPHGRAGERMYRTGDLARVRRDGSIEYLGRADEQVKLRGYRIELGEIEARLRAHPWVREAAVVLRREPQKSARLVGYVVLTEAAHSGLAQAAATLAEVLERHLRQALPEYMVPRAFLVLQALPLLPSGKLDRRALPAPDPSDVVSEFVAPATPFETELAAIWAELLGLERIGTRDNFFELGGDSIVALQVVGRARSRGLALTPKQLFQHQTVHALAAAAEPCQRHVAAQAWGPAAGLDPQPGEPARGEPPRRDFSALLAPLGVEPDEIEDAYAMTPMQQGLMLHSLISQGSGVYHMQAVFRVRRALDEAAFHRAWQLVVERHAMLRAAFRVSDETGPLQLVYRRAPAPSQLITWPVLPEAEREARLQRYLADERARGFDLSQPSSFHVRLIQLGAPRPAAEGEPAYYVVVSNHHILMDDWCMSLLWHDFFVCYEACAQQREPPAAALPPFRRYVEWLERQDMERARTFWKDELAGFRYPTPLPFRTLSDDDELHNRHVQDAQLWLSEAATEALRLAARRHELTPNTFVQAAWAWVLARHAGVDDVLFGVIAAGRPMELAEVESMVGLFIQAIPLRLRLPRGAKVRDWLAQILEKNAELRQYEYLPLTEIRRAADVRSQSLFHSLFVYENAPFDSRLVRDAESLGVEMLADRTHTNYPITVVVYPGRRLGLHLSYNAELFGAEQMQLLLAQLRRALEALVSGLDRELGALSFATDAELERAAVLNQTERELGAASYIERFEQQVVLRGEQQAARCLDRSLSYLELDARSNRVAHALIAAGVGADDRVALLDERGLELLVAMLGTFKSGAAYVPLDPAQPVQRLAQVLALAQPRAVVCTGAFRARVDAALSSTGPGQRPALVLLDALDGGTAAPPRRAVHPRSLAYLIYTSGSTGVPKGVMVEQRGMLNNQLSKVPYLGLTAADVIAQTASQCFDISVWQFLTALLIGARVEIIPDAISHDPAGLLRHVAEAGVTVLESVPSLLQSALASEGLPPPDQLRLRWLLPTGEALPIDVARAWFRRYPGVPLVNAYGPAECSDDVSLHSLRAAPPSSATRVPIGAAVDNTRLHVLDERLRPVPFGVTGELCVAGIQVGRGYLGDPARTAERFIPDPFGEPGGRLYRTGDLAARAPGGELEFSGRIDHQIKLRGYRIELGEIEARLLASARVRAAAVVARQVAPGDQRLVAYVVLHDGGAPDGGAGHAGAGDVGASLRAELAQSLPEYMLPSAIVRLPALPLGSNGKLDRERLPEPEWRVEERSFVAPQGDTEQVLAGVWRELLGVERVGRHDDFVELGGHSLLAVRMIQAASKRLGQTLPLALAFQHPVLGELAGAVESRSLLDSARSVLALERAGAGTPLYCLHPAGGHVLSYRGLARALRGQRPVYGLQARSFYRDDWIDESIEAMAAHYADEIEATTGRSPIHLLGWSFGGLLAVEVALACQRRGIEIRVVALIDSTDLLGEGGWNEAGTPQPPAAEASDQDTQSPGALARWIDGSKLRAQWQRLLAVDDGVARFLLAQFGARQLAGQQLDLVQERELFNAANCVILSRGYSPAASGLPVHTFWASATLAEGSDPRPLAEKLAIAGSSVIEGDHESIVGAPQLLDAVLKLLDGH